MAMDRKRQQYCSAVGGAVVMASGVLAVSCYLYTSSSVAMSFFEARLCGSLFVIGCVLVVLGAGGILASWGWNRFALCTYAWIALLLSFVCAVLGASCLLQVPTDVQDFDDACEKMQAGLNGSMPPNAAAAHGAYLSMREALNWCRQYNPLALRLDACPDATDTHGNPWASNDFVGLFRWAENAYSCGGLCQDALPLFALPEGTIDEDNKGDARPACFAPLTDEIRTNAGLACATLLGVSLWLLVPMLSACWLACAPPPARRPNYVHRPEELEWAPIARQLDEANDWDDRDETDDDEDGGQGRSLLRR